MLDDIVDKYNNTYHQTIILKPIDIKSSSYTEYNVDSNVKDSKFKTKNRLRVSKYKSTFSKGYACNWSEKVFIIRKNLPWTYIITDVNGEEIVRTFYKNELQKNIQKEFRIEKVIKRKGNKSYVKLKGYDN